MLGGRNMEGYSKTDGPKTEAGKRASSLNALKHGLTAETVALPHESEDEYNAALAAYLDHFQPADLLGKAAVERLGSTLVNLRHHDHRRRRRGYGRHRRGPRW